LPSTEPASTAPYSLVARAANEVGMVWNAGEPPAAVDVYYWTATLSIP